VIRLYIDHILNPRLEVNLKENQSHYIQNVMRLKEGDTIFLFNGKDGEWEAKIVAISKKATRLLLLSQNRPQQQEEDVWLLFSPLKPKRQEFLIEKATELGASQLWPTRCERTSVPRINTEKMRAHSIEAAEQSERLTIPKIYALESLPTLLKNWPRERVLLFGDETLHSPSLGKFSLEDRRLYAFLVGPEGGFTPHEISLLKAHPQAYGVTLNSHILRAETAAIVGLSYLQMKLMEV